MLKTLMLIAIAAPLTLAFRDLYCPECERFSADEWSIDAKGLCRGCLRRPVGVEATARRWTWCGSHGEWRNDACSYAPSRRCCTEWTATSLVELPAEAEVAPAPFCPQCRTFGGFAPGADGRDRCAGCGKPPATADAAEITWFWCRGDERWGVERCDRDRSGKCCSPRTVKLPVAWIVPMPRPVSTGEEPGVLVTTDWLAAHLDDMDVAVVHVEFGSDAADAAVRTAFDEGHVPFAHPLEWRAVATARDGLPDEFPPASEMTEAVRRMGIGFHSRVVLYDTGAGLEAARAFVALEYLGLAGRVSVLDGQWKKWLREGHELSRVYSGVEHSDFVPAIRSDVLVDRRGMEDFVWAGLEAVPTAVVIDARSAEEYVGALPGKGVLRPGHLPGAMCLPWTSMIASRDNPVSRPEAELRGLLEGKGARPGRRVLAYCRTGVQASLLYVAARRLDLPVSLYDGSYAEWSRLPGLPVEGRWTGR